jgi:hypothetical protein
MRESRTYGSGRGARGNSRPYRELTNRSERTLDGARSLGGGEAAGRRRRASPNLGLLPRPRVVGIAWSALLPLRLVGLAALRDGVTTPALALPGLAELINVDAAHARLFTPLCTGAGCKALGAHLSGGI